MRRFAAGFVAFPVAFVAGVVLVLVWDRRDNRTSVKEKAGW